MGCDPQTFENVTAAQWQTLKSGVQGQLGIAIVADTGEDGKMGVTIRWDYDPARRRLTLTCTEKPFFMSCDAINAQIANAVERAQLSP